MPITGISVVTRNPISILQNGIPHISGSIAILVVKEIIPYASSLAYLNISEEDLGIWSPANLSSNHGFSNWDPSLVYVARNAGESTSVHWIRFSDPDQSQVYNIHSTEIFPCVPPSKCNSILMAAQSISEFLGTKNTRSSRSHRFTGQRWSIQISGVLRICITRLPSSSLWCDIVAPIGESTSGIQVRRYIVVLNIDLKVASMLTRV